MFLPGGLLPAGALDFLLEQPLGLQVLPPHLDHLPVVVLLLRVPLVARTRDRRQEQVVQALQLLELVTRGRPQHHNLWIPLPLLHQTPLCLLIQARREEDLLHPGLDGLGLLLLTHSCLNVVLSGLGLAVEEGGEEAAAAFQLLGGVPQGLPRHEPVGDSEVEHELWPYAHTLLPSHSAIALQ